MLTPSTGPQPFTHIFNCPGPYVQICLLQSASGRSALYLNASLFPMLTRLGGGLNSSYWNASLFPMLTRLGGLNSLYWNASLFPILTRWGASTHPTGMLPCFQAYPVGGPKLILLECFLVSNAYPVGGV